MEQIAAESEKIKRARRKLERKLAKIDHETNSKALERSSKEIHRWIERHSHARITLKDKSIALFDENRNSAELSRKVANLAQQIGDNISTPLELLLDQKEETVNL